MIPYKQELFSILCCCECSTLNRHCECMPIVERSIKFRKCSECQQFSWNIDHRRFSIEFLLPDKTNKKINGKKLSQLNQLTQLWCENLQGLVKFINSSITMRAVSSQLKPFNYTFKFWIIFASSRFQTHLSFGYKVHLVKGSDLLKCLFSWERCFAKRLPLNQQSCRASPSSWL